MESDDRLLQIPEIHDPARGRELQSTPQEYPPAYSPYYDDEALGENRSVREYFNVVYKRLPLILAITVLTTAAVALYMYQQPTRYSSTAKMVIEPPKPKATDTQSVNINLGYDPNYYNTQLQLMQSPDLMRDVIIKLKLYEQEDLSGGRSRGLFSSITSIFSGEKKSEDNGSSLPIIASGDNSNISDEIEQISLTPEQEMQVGAHVMTLSTALLVEKVEATNLVNITVTHVNPDLAKAVSGALAEQFVKKSTDLAVRGQKDALDQLEDSIVELQKSISEKEQRYISELRASNLPVGDGKANDLAANRLGTVSSQLLQAIDDRRKLEAEYSAALRAKNPYALSDTSGSAVASQLREIRREQAARAEEQIRAVDEKIKAAEAELAKLRVTYTDEYRKVKEAVSELEQLRKTKADIEKESSQRIEEESRKLEQEVQKDITSALAARLATARNRENQLSAAYEREVAAANKQGQAETSLTTLRREIETNRNQLDIYIRRQKEQELSIESGRPDNLKVSSVQDAFPVGPNRPRNILIALLVSLVGGIGLSFLLDYLDDSIKSSDDVGRGLGLPTLGLIPHQKSLDKKSVKMLPSAGAKTLSTEFVALEDNRSAMAEAYRHLRTSLLFSSAGKPPETILVTSSQPSEGKTTTAINTAITLAQSGADVVIIDCDLRRPRLHSLFNMENTHGLTNYLSGERDTDNLLKQFPHLPNLKVITSGPIPPNPAELLSSNEMKHLLQFLRGRFKHVVIDSPPAISFTDAAIISTLVDGVVLVAMAGKSSVHLMRRFKQRLINMGARVYGVVLNGIKPNSIEYGYYGYGYTYKYYENGEDDSTPMMEDKNGGLGDEWVEEVDEDPRRGNGNGSGR